MRHEPNALLSSEPSILDVSKLRLDTVKALIEHVKQVFADRGLDISERALSFHVNKLRQFNLGRSTPRIHQKFLIGPKSHGFLTFMFNTF
jgi:hypothetical protein